MDTKKTVTKDQRKSERAEKKMNKDKKQEKLWTNRTGKRSVLHETYTHFFLFLFVCECVAWSLV